MLFLDSEYATADLTRVANELPRGVLLVVTQPARAGPGLADRADRAPRASAPVRRRPAVAGPDHLRRQRARDRPAHRRRRVGHDRPGAHHREAAHARGHGARLHRHRGPVGQGEVVVPAPRAGPGRAADGRQPRELPVAPGRVQRVGLQQRRTGLGGARRRGHLGRRGRADQVGADPRCSGATRGTTGAGWSSERSPPRCWRSGSRPWWPP